MEQIPLAYGLTKETTTAPIILHKNTKSMVRSPDSDTNFFDIITGIFQRDASAPFLFIIYLDFELGTSIDLMK